MKKAMKMPIIFSAIAAIFMQITPTNIFFQNWNAIHNSDIHTIINSGGTSSSKTFSVLQALNRICEKRTLPLLTSVVSESMPHLRLSAIRDFKKILGDSFDHDAWHETEHTYTYRPDVMIEFFSADNPGKVHGPRRDILFLNEAINIPKTVCDNLIVRTRSKVLVDFNPTGEFWAHDLKGKPGVKWIHSTYLDAKDILPAETVARIESRRNDPNWWNVYGLGQIGMVEGLVHSLFTQCDSIPEGGIDFYGIDFGFTNDPTAIIHCRVIGDTLYSDEIVYQTGLDNAAICRELESAGVKKDYDEIFYDCAEPKSGSEIRLRGYNAKPAPKGEDSVRVGIEKVNTYKQVWTKRSTHCIKEQRNYRYIINQDGRLTQKPIDNWNHGMDARRYGVIGKLAAEANTPGILGVSDDNGYEGMYDVA